MGRISYVLGPRKIPCSSQMRLSRSTPRVVPAAPCPPKTASPPEGSLHRKMPTHTEIACFQGSDHAVDAHHAQDVICSSLSTPHVLIPPRDLDHGDLSSVTTSSSSTRSSTFPSPAMSPQTPIAGYKVSHMEVPTSSMLADKAAAEAVTAAAPTSSSMPRNISSKLLSAFPSTAVEQGSTAGAGTSHAAARNGGTLVDYDALNPNYNKSGLNGLTQGDVLGLTTVR